MQGPVKRWRGAMFLAMGGAAVLATLQARTAVAYDRYNSGCHTCHGAFTHGTSPKGTVFPGDDKHRMHRDSNAMATDCNLCHTAGDGYNPFIGSSNGTVANPGVGCTGCHGRDYGGSTGNSGAGLRAHHAINGVNVCAACHPNDPVPLPENVNPVYYGTPDTRVDDPCNSGPDYLENWSVGDTQGLDNDGDNLYDAADPDVPTWYRDADDDGFGDRTEVRHACDRPAGFVADSGDCDDDDPTVHPGATEACDGKDSDCVGGVPPEEIDADGDGLAECDGDCDDNDDTVFPGAPELCDGVDNDCDGQVDQEIPTWHRDADGDGFGDPSASRQTCDQPTGYVSDASDCDDSDDAVFPGAAELCDGQDNDCDEVLPEEEADDDGDGIINCLDNCPTEANPDQADRDGNGVGDACAATDEVPPEPDEGGGAEPSDDAERDETDEAAADQAPVGHADRSDLERLALAALLGVTLCGFGILPAVAVSSLGLVVMKMQRRFFAR